MIMTLTKAREIVDHYCDAKGCDPNDETTFIDLVTDVLILAQAQGMNALAIGRMAAVHVSAETGLVKEEGSWPE